jgi:cytidylate kinase
MFGDASIQRMITFYELSQRRKQQAIERAHLPPVITISCQPGGGGQEVAALLGQKGWTVWDRELVNEIANDIHVQRQIVEHLDERAESLLEEMFQALFGATTITFQTYLRWLHRTILSIAAQGNAVIIGRGANFILPKALKVRAIASFDYRVEKLMALERMSEEEATRYIARSDQQRINFIRQCFGRDIDDASQYDMVIRMDDFRIPDAAEVIQLAAQIKFSDLETQYDLQRTPPDGDSA